MKLNSRDRKILRIALPSIVSNITVPLLGLVDLAIMGHVGDAVYIGAIAVGAMMFNIIYWIFGFLRMGTSGLTSQALGRRDLREVVLLLARSLAVGMAVALCLLLLQRPLLWLLLRLLSPTADVAPLAARYFSVCVWGAPAMLGLYGLTGWFVGMQNTRAPMLVSIFQNVVNIAASLLLVLCAGLRVEGVALGTVIAQWAGFGLGVALLVAHYGRLRRYFSPDGIFAHAAMSRFFAVNRDIFLRTLCLVAVNLWFTSAGARQGAVVLAVNTLLLQLYILFSYVMDGFAYAGEALCGRYHGAGNASAFRATLHRLWMWGGAMAALFTVVYAFGGTPFLRLLTSDEAVVAASADYFAWAVAIPVAGVGAFVWDGVFVGLTATRAMLVSLAVAAAAFFAAYAAFADSWGNHALWLAMITYLAMRGLAQTVMYATRHVKCAGT